MSAPCLVVVMGVCGAGKTTLGQALAESLGCRYAEGDSFHPPANVEKMRAGRALDDADRGPWLMAINAELRGAEARRESLVVSCSALKRDYRALLRAGLSDLIFMHLEGDPEMLRARLEARRDHYMPPSLLDSQLATLESPGEEECVLRLEAARPLGELVETALAALAPARREGEG